MAHVVVYLQRTTRGLHPGSMVALSLAREVGDERGAAVLGLCLGDAGAFDDRLVVEASRSGADQIVFLGPEGIPKLFRRLSPRHVFSPYTREAGSVLAQAGIGPMVGRLVDGPPANVRKLEPVVGTIAGILPWQQSPLQIEPEYEADVTQVQLPEWLVAAADRVTDLTTTAEQPPLLYTAPGIELDAETQAALTSLGAYPVTPDGYSGYREGTLLWFDGAGQGLPVTLVERSPGLRVILLPGPGPLTGPVDSSWGMADFVLAGEWPVVVREFNGAAWKRMFV
jgi:hypothetical protein